MPQVSDSIMLLRNFLFFIFDLDGTLVQTEWNYLLLCLHRAIRRSGGSIFPDRFQAEAFWFGSSNGDRNQLVRDLFGLDPEIFWPQLKELDTPANRLANTGVIDGVRQVLRLLKHREKLLGVITAARPQIANPEIRLLDFHFDAVLSVSEHPELPCKPEPDGLRYMINKLGCLRDQVVYVGDSGEDYAFARAAGVPFVLYQPEGRSVELLGEPLFTFGDWRHSPFLEV